MSCASPAECTVCIWFSVKSQMEVQLYKLLNHILHTHTHTWSCAQEIYYDWCWLSPASCKILHCPSIGFHQALSITSAFDSFLKIFSKESPWGQAPLVLFLLKSHVSFNPIKRSPDGLSQSSWGVAAELIFFQTSWKHLGITSVCLKPSTITYLCCLKESLVLLIFEQISTCF